MTQPLHIHFFANMAHSQGTYFRFHNLAVSLAKLGQEVIVFTEDYDSSSTVRQEIREGVEYHITPTSKGTSLFYPPAHPLNALRRSLKRYPVCDVAHLFQPFPSAALAWRLRRNSTIALYDWDDLWNNGATKPGLTRGGWPILCAAALEKSLPRKADHVTTCSHFLADLAKQRGAAGETILHNGFWPFTPSSKSAAREKLGLDQEAIYVGFMGATASELDWCLEALKVNLDKPLLRFCLCGPEYFKNSISALPDDVQKRIDFLGHLPTETTRDFAAALDLGLLPLEDTPFNQSRFPIKYAEYMAAGAPVLCSNVGECAQLSDNFPWVIKAGKTKAEWLASFEKAIVLIENREIPAVDRAIVEKSFSWNVSGQKLLDLYNSMLETRGK